MSRKSWSELGWIRPIDQLPPEFKHTGITETVLALAETDDGCLQITPARKKVYGAKEWREVRFDHKGEGRKIGVRLWMPMPPFSREATPALTPST